MTEDDSWSDGANGGGRKGVDGDGRGGADSRGREGVPRGDRDGGEDWTEIRDLPDTLDEEERGLRPREVDRVFTLLEEAIDSDALGGRQLDRLLSVLEESVTATAETDPETVAELVSMLEETIVEPEDIGEVDVDGILSVLEEAIVGVTVVEQEDVADVFDVVQAAIEDPTGIEPEDAERFRQGIHNAIFDVTDPTGSIGELLSLSVDDPEGADAQPVDTVRIARIAAAMTQRATGHSMESAVRTGTRMAYAAANSQSPAELLTSTRAIALDELQRAGIDIGDDQVEWLEAHEGDLVDPRPVTREALEEQGERLITQSAEVGRDESVHPAYPTLLDQLATDEARILRLLATEGPQGAIDVYDRRYIPYRKRIVARHLTMLGSDAGCRNRRQTPLYLQNLRRLGLVEVWDDPIDDLKRYEIIEAQAHVEAAREEAGRARTVYRSVRLTDLGVDFCEICFPFAVTVDRDAARFRSDDGQ